MMDITITVAIIFLFAGLVALACYTADCFKSNRIVQEARARRLYQLECEMWEVKQLLKKGKKK